jgi:hypothetical protein
MNHHAWLLSLKPGDIVNRMLGGVVSMHLKVSKVDDLIHCGPYTFSLKDGAEIDPELGWEEGNTGSFIKEPMIGVTVTIHIPEEFQKEDDAPSDPV